MSSNSNLYKILSSLFILLFLAFFSMAQMPKNIPHDTGPVEFLDSPLNILLFIALPILLVVFYIWWRKFYQNKHKDKKDQ
ncbi:MAG: hypothetical protein WD048_00395 [Chitinophagales bacterium]